jgi:riboflavin synthase
MFTGIVVAVAPVSRVDALSAGGRRLALRWPKTLPRPRAGESVAVDGVCLTARRGRGETVAFDLSPETLARTTLGRLKTGERVHLEPALTARAPLGGHFVTGHVDGVGAVRAIVPLGEDFLRLVITVPRALLPLIAVKGSLAVDGVSLTVNEKRGSRISFVIVPHTREATRFGDYRPGTPVNLEADLVARYVANFLTATAHGR